MAQFLIALVLLTEGNGSSQLQAGDHMGLRGDHKLSDLQKGLLLQTELNCRSCHETGGSEDRRGAPDLIKLSSQLRADYMMKFIADPKALKAHGMMPSMMEHLPAEQRVRNSEAIVHYLKKQAGNPKFKHLKGKAEAGKELFNSVGCVVCHSEASAAVEFKNLDGKYRPDALADFLLSPLESRPSARMPDMKLNRQEAADLQAFLGQGSEENFKVDDGLAQLGEKLFKQLNCSSCHSSERSAPIAISDDQGGCLSGDKGKWPHYDLSGEERELLRKSLPATTAAKMDSLEKSQVLMSQFNCIACHSRDGYGGPSQSMDKFFKTTEEGLGRHARIPPDLSGVGAKLQSTWLHRLFTSGTEVRPYMQTRMPLFGENNARHLIEAFSHDKAVKAFPKIKVGRKEKGPYIKGGHQLTGKDGLNCISCHNFADKPSPGMKGLDLLTSPVRLKKEWFMNFMINPQKYRPGIIMPSFWPGGQAMRKDILEGDTVKQLEGMWRYLSEGRTARLPSGIRRENNELAVGAETLMHRGTGAAGPRGIAVGFPNKMSYAFDAVNMNISSLWSGRFVSVYWSGQGNGSFNIHSRDRFDFQRGLPLAELTDLESPWPQRKPRPGKRGVNTDPQYPWRFGYSFKGYYLDQRKQPVFLYDYKDFHIEDKTLSPEEGRYRRSLNVKSDKKAELFWRLAVADEITPEQGGFLLGDRLRIVSPQAFIRSSGGGKELLLRLPLNRGENQFEITYEVKK